MIRSIILTIVLVFPFSIALSAQINDDRTFAAGTTVYIHSNNGLVVREKPSRNGKRLASIGFGQSATVIAPPDKRQTLEVAGIKGFWVNVKHGAGTGYVFSGFISKFPVAKNRFFPVYHKKLQSLKLPSTYTNKPVNTPGKPQPENENTETLVLKGATMADAYLIARSLFEVPKSIKWPKKLTKKTTSINNPKKSEGVHESTLTLSAGPQGTLNKINYFSQYDGGSEDFRVSAVDSETIKFEFAASVD